MSSIVRRPPWAAVFMMAALSILPAACDGSADGSADTTNQAEPLTGRQRDSVIGTLPLPGAGALGGALRASDQARERAEAHDTIR